MTWRGTIRLVGAALLVMIYVPLLAIVRPFGRGQWIVMGFLRQVGRLLGLRVSVTGVPVRGAVLIAANHISWLDILALGGAVPCRFIAKAEIEGWPLVGWLATLGKAVFVARDRRSAARAQADAVVTALHETWPVVLFAEGGTGDGLAVTPFRASLFASAVEAGTAVQPVAIDYGPDRARLAWPSHQSFGPEAKRLLNRSGRVPVTLRFLAPLDGRTLDRKTLAAKAQAAVVDALG